MKDPFTTALTTTLGPRVPLVQEPPRWRHTGRSEECGGAEDALRDLSEGMPGSDVSRRKTSGCGGTESPTGENGMRVRRPSDEVE